MTIYEFFVESTTANVRLEVPHPGLAGSVELMQRLDELVAQGAGRRVGTGFGELADELTLTDVRRLLRGVDEVHVGRPTKPEPGPLVAIPTALAAVPPDSVFSAVFFET